MSTFALMGSGEFEPWSVEMDREVLARANGDGRVVILPTASAKEGDEVFDDWAAKGLAHYASFGIPAEVIPLKVRDDASRPELIARLEGASVAFFSGWQSRIPVHHAHRDPVLERAPSRDGSGPGLHRL